MVWESLIENHSYINEYPVIQKFYVYGEHCNKDKVFYADYSACSVALRSEMDSYTQLDRVIFSVVSLSMVSNLQVRFLSSSWTLTSDESSKSGIHAIGE